MSHASTPSLARPARNWRAAGMRLAFVAAAMVVAAPALALEPFTATCRSRIVVRP